MSNVLVIQNTLLEGTGVLGELLSSDGFKIVQMFAKNEKLPKNDYAILIVLGAPQSVNDNLSYLKDEVILEEYKNLETNPNFKIFPSIRFEYFLTLLKHSEFIIGNSSTGIREAEVFGIPSINIGSRQQNRSNNTDIVNVTRVVKDDILKAIKGIKNKKYSRKNNFGEIEESSERFFQVLKDEKIWKISFQKQFIDLNNIQNSYITKINDSIRNYSFLTKEM